MNIIQAPAMLFTGDAERTFYNPNGVLTIEGGSYRNSPWATNSRDKPSFNLYFRDEYEDSSITFPIFGKDYPVDTFEQLRPRAGKNDINNPHVKDKVMRRLYLDMGNIGSRGIFNSLYVNGEWKGFYNTPVTLPQSVVTVKSRLRSPGGEWSALTEAEFKVSLAQPSSTNLVICEVYYHPAPPTPTEAAAGFSDPDDFEFLQLRNIGSQSLDLSGLSFSTGILFNFEGSLVTSLDPGAFVIVVRSLDAFRLRYGLSFDPLLAGQYTAGLSNGGERLTLESSGVVIRDFSYDDSNPWPACADGDGISLVLVNATGNPDHALASSWTGSAQIGGLPGGQPRPLSYAEWQSYVFAPGQASGPSDDPDGDGLPNLIEFYLGSLPEKNDAGAHAPQPSFFEDGGEEYLTLTFSAVSNQSSLQGLVEVSNDLEIWSSASGEIGEVLPAAVNDNGTITRTFRVPNPVASIGKQFIRLRVFQN